MEQRPEIPPELQPVLDELAARADAAQKLAVIALEELHRMASGERRSLDYAAWADELERHPHAGKSAIEERGRAIAGGLLRALADHHPPIGR